MLGLQTFILYHNDFLPTYCFSNEGTIMQNFRNQSEFYSTIPIKHSVDLDFLNDDLLFEVV